MELILALAALVGLLVVWRRFRRRPRDRPLMARRFRFAGGAFGYSELSANMLVTGITGGGKSSAMQVLLSELLRDGCGLFLPADKPGDAQRYVRMAQRAGRTDVYLFDSSCRLRANFLDCAVGGGDPATVALQAEAAFFQVAQALNATQGGGRADDPYWTTNSKRWTRFAFRLVVLAGFRPSVPLLVEVINSTPASPDAIKTDALRGGVCFRLLRAAFERYENTARWDEYVEVESFFLREVPGTADRTRSGFVSGVFGPADVLASGIPKAILCSDSTVDLSELVATNAVIVTDFPLGTAGAICPIINTALKYSLQKTLLRRTVRDDTRPFVLALDEWQTMLSDSDFEYLALCRSARGPIIGMTQGYESLMACFPGNSAEHKVNVLTGNCNIRAFMSPTPATSAWLDKLLGQRLRMMLGGSTAVDGYRNPLDFLTGTRTQSTGTFSQQFTPWLTPGELAGLRTGGAANGRWVDFILTIAGRTWGGAPFTVASVRQEGS